MNSVLAQVILDVRDLDRSLHFYRDLLGLRVVREECDEGDRIARLGTGGTEMLLVQQSDSASGRHSERGGGLILNFRVKDLPAMADALNLNRVVVLRRLDMAVWGERTLLVQDPDGYAVLLSEPVAVSQYSRKSP